jgi:hypothetical protein
MGADLFMEATGLPEVVYPGVEKVIWEGRTINSTVVVTARANAKMPVMGEVLQVRRARIIGAQGHSGHGNFPRVIECMASGMEADEVLPTRSRLTYTFSAGIPSRSPTALMMRRLAWCGTKRSTSSIPTPALVRTSWHTSVIARTATLNVSFQKTAYKVNRVKITIDQSVLGLGWNEIDAVELVGTK